MWLRYPGTFNVTLLFRGMGAPAGAQVFKQAGGSSVEVVTKGGKLLNAPEACNCPQSRKEIPLLVTIGRDGLVKGAQLGTTSNSGIPDRMEMAIANASKLRFAPLRKAKRHEWIFITYNAPTR